jgi:hypothetical protein
MGSHACPQHHLQRSGITEQVCAHPHAGQHSTQHRLRHVAGWLVSFGPVHPCLAAQAHTTAPSMQWSNSCWVLGLQGLPRLHQAARLFEGDTSSTAGECCRLLMLYCARTPAHPCQCTTWVCVAAACVLPACLHACLRTSLLVNTVQDTAHAVVILMQASTMSVLSLHGHPCLVSNTKKMA